MDREPKNKTGSRARTLGSMCEGLNLEGSTQSDVLSTCSSPGGVTLGCM